MDTRTPPPASRAVSSAKARAAGSAPLAPRTSSPRACSSAASSTAASSGIGSRNRGYGANGAVRIATPTTAPASRATAYQCGDQPAVGAAGRVLPGASASPWWTAASRASRSATVATTVLTTGSAARCSPATARNAAGSSKNSRSMLRR